MKNKSEPSIRIAALGAIAAYASIFSAFMGFIGVTFTLLASSLLLALKAVGTRRIKQFFVDLIGT